MTDAVIASHYDANRRAGPGLIIMTTEGYDYLVARNWADEGFYLVWDGSPEPPVFDEATYDAVVKEASQGEVEADLSRLRSLQPLSVGRRLLPSDTGSDTHGLRCWLERALQQRIRNWMLTLFRVPTARPLTQITERFAAYLSQPAGRVVGTKVTYVPFYQALASITAAGKTVIMAQTVAELLPDASRKAHRHLAVEGSGRRRPDACQPGWQVPASPRRI